VSAALDAARATARGLPDRGGFHAMISGRATADRWTAVLAWSAERHALGVRTALAVRDWAALRRAAAGLAGAGAGLTPSGDDYVAGLLAAIAFLRSSGVAGVPAADETDALADDVAARTSEFSGFLVRRAARGLVSAPVCEWLKAIVAGRVSEAPARTEALAAIGHSSGIDTLAGLLDVLEAFAWEPPWIR
jgi:hypothetical protein